MPLVAHIVPPRQLKAFPDARSVKPKSQRRRWKDNDGKIYEWDSQHGTVEIFDKQGHHIGEYDADTGAQTKPRNSNYAVEP
jgi:hypothetical protein